MFSLKCGCQVSGTSGHARLMFPRKSGVNPFVEVRGLLKAPKIIIIRIVIIIIIIIMIILIIVLNNNNNNNNNSNTVFWRGDVRGPRSP